MVPGSGWRSRKGSVRLRPGGASCRASSASAWRANKEAGESSRGCSHERAEPDHSLRRRRRGESRAARKHSRPARLRGGQRRQRERRLGEDQKPADRPRASGRHDAGDGRLRGLPADQGGPKAPEHTGHHDHGADRQGRPHPRHRGRGGGVPVKAVRPDRSAGQDQDAVEGERARRRPSARGGGAAKSQ